MCFEEPDAKGKEGEKKKETRCWVARLQEGPQMQHIKRIESEAYSIFVPRKQISWLGIGRLRYYCTFCILVSSVQGVASRLDLTESIKSLTVCNPF